MNLLVILRGIVVYLPTNQCILHTFNILYDLVVHHNIYVTFTHIMFALQCFVVVRIIHVMSFYIQIQSLIIMVVKCNQFIDDDNLTDKSSLIHLLDSHDADDCDEIPLLKHSPFYSEYQFTSLINTNYGLCILDMNIANAFPKFDELEAFINMVN